MPTVYHWQRSVLVSSLLLLLFFVFKTYRFQSLYYTFNDMYIFIQSSSSWLDGRPVLYENIWGFDSRIHNNYILLLLGPLVYLSGAYGVFAVLTVLMALSYGLLLRALAARGPWFYWLMFVVILFGPVWFWFNDHPGIGWHPELLYYPLVLLFTLALFYAETNWYFWVTATLIVLVKEDGALLAGTVHLAYLCLTYLRANPTQSVLGVLTNRRFWLTAGSWALVFLAGMLFLSYKNHSIKPEPRLEQALAAIQVGVHDQQFIGANLLLLMHTLGLLLPSIILLLLAMNRTGFRRQTSVLLIYVVAQLALLGSNWVQGSTYYGSNPLFYLVSLTWPPRFVLVYAFSVSFVVGFWLLFGADARPLSAGWITGLAVGLFVIQVPVVNMTRPDVDYKDALIDTFTHRFDPIKEPLLPNADVAVVERIARLIPARSNVFMFDFLIPFFHRHYNIWLTGRQWGSADLAIIPINDFQGLKQHLPSVMKQPYQHVRLRMYDVYTTPAYASYVNQAIHDTR